MKRKKFLYTIFLSLCMATSLFAKKRCLPDESIKVQKRRAIAQGLLVDLTKSKLLFAWPVEYCKCWVSSLFGWRKNPNGTKGFHSGVDLAASRGTTVMAAADGFVDYAGYHKGYGNMVLIVHYGTGYATRYAHLDSIDVKLDQAVVQGQKIGTVGATGHVRTAGSTGDPSHLHFEMYKKSQRVDPLKYLFSSEIARQRRGISINF